LSSAQLHACQVDNVDDEHNRKCAAMDVPTENLENFPQFLPSKTPQKGTNSQKDGQLLSGVAKLIPLSPVQSLVTESSYILKNATATYVQQAVAAAAAAGVTPLHHPLAESASLQPLPALSRSSPLISSGTTAAAAAAAAAAVALVTAIPPS
uniref:Krueppel-like factor 15 n=1 Tax=Gongylonema pulchrum TaxID=637853 RepID=A0A183D889_9BILA